MHGCTQQQQWLTGFPFFVFRLPVSLQGTNRNIYEYRTEGRAKTTSSRMIGAMIYSVYQHQQQSESRLGLCCFLPACCCGGGGAATAAAQAVEYVDTTAVIY